VRAPVRGCVFARPAGPPATVSILGFATLNTKELAMRYTILAALLALPACVDGPESSSTQQQPVTKDICPAEVPAQVVPAADQDLAFALEAEGVQSYACADGAWVFIAPDADLYQHDNPGPVGHHFAGPTWEYQDGSSVVAKKTADAKADPSSIPWLLLVATSHAGDEGRMTEITSIQRLETAGGLAPSGPCAVGATLEVPYTATYFFYRTKADGTKSNVRCGG